jgi:DNA-binding transcriptional LysR family regulator
MAASSSDIPLLNLPTLAAIARHGSFSKAADALDLNRAAISKRIAQLEKALGVPVLARTTRKVQLTLAGKALLSRHLEAETLLNMAVDEARGTMLAMGGTVRVTCANSSLAVHLIGPALFAFANANSGIQVDMSAIVDEATTSQADIELRITDEPPPDRSARLLAHVSWSFQATKSYVARFGTPHSPDDLLQHRCVVPAARDKPAAFIHRSSGEARAVTLNNAMTSNVQEVIFELVKRGEAIGFLPNFLSANASKALGLRELLTEWRLQSLPAQSLYAIHAPAKYQRAATRSVLAHLESLCSLLA